MARWRHQSPSNGFHPYLGKEFFASVSVSVVVLYFASPSFLHRTNYVANNSRASRRSYFIIYLLHYGSSLDEILMDSPHSKQNGWWTDKVADDIIAENCLERRFDQSWTLYLLFKRRHSAKMIMYNLWLFNQLLPVKLFVASTYLFEELRRGSITLCVLLIGNYLWNVVFFLTISKHATFSE